MGTGYYRPLRKRISIGKKGKPGEGKKVGRGRYRSPETKFIDRANDSVGGSRPGRFTFDAERMPKRKRRRERAAKAKAWWIHSPRRDPNAKGHRCGPRKIA